MTSSCKPTLTCIVSRVKNAAGHGSRLTGTESGHVVLRSPVNSMEGPCGGAAEGLRFRRCAWCPGNPGNTQMDGTRAATESFVIGRHARPFVIRQPLRQKFQMLGAISTILAMACVLLRNRSGPISIPNSLPSPCLDSLLCTMQMLPGVNVAPDRRACSQRRTTSGTCGSRQNVRG